jgi:hypothetical protein
METIKWGAFKTQLQQWPALDLQFQYATDKWVAASYHITEIKLSPIVSVDCGGVLNKWTEVIVQLWEPDEKQQERAMKVSKALSIIDLVEKSIELDTNAIVKIEFGNSQFDTRQMFPGEIVLNGENLIVDLRPDFVRCKAIDRGGSCGTNDNGEECCTPPEKQKIELVNLVATNLCIPGSGCC